uniref:Putative actin depolymerizing factor n=1 Tax=Ixodes ricinus TaxID=34613 RepID=A0A0K8RCI5_IXORI
MRLLPSPPHPPLPLFPPRAFFTPLKHLSCLKDMRKDCGQTKETKGSWEVENCPSAPPRKKEQFLCTLRLFLVFFFYLVLFYPTKLALTLPFVLYACCERITGCLLGLRLPTVWLVCGKDFCSTSLQAGCQCFLFYS